MMLKYFQLFWQNCSLSDPKMKNMIENMTKQISHSTIIKLLGEFSTRIQNNGITLVYEDNVLYNVTGFGNLEYYDCPYTEFVDIKDYWQFMRDFTDMWINRTLQNYELKLITTITNKPNRIHCYEYIRKSWRKKFYLISYYDINIIDGYVKGTIFDN